MQQGLSAHKGLAGEDWSRLQHQAQSQASSSVYESSALKTHKHIDLLAAVHRTEFVMKAAGIASPALGTTALLPRHLARKSSMAAGGIRAASRKHDSHDQSSQQVSCRFGSRHAIVHFGTAAATGRVS